MLSNKHGFRTASFEDGTYAVLRADPVNPRLLEVIATFYDAAHAQDYVRFHSTHSGEHQEERRPIVKGAAKAKPQQASRAKRKQLSAAKPKLGTGTKPKRAAEVQAKPVPEVRRDHAPSGVSERQAAVLKALSSSMDKKHHVEVRQAELAKASSVPLGSLHSILASLEKKHMIRTERQGSAKLPAIYEVLETSRRSTHSLNGVVRGKQTHAPATR